MARLLLPLVLVTLLLSACGDDDPLAFLDDEELADRDLDAIVGDTLHVLAAYNSTTYFVYRGMALGYEFELLEQFADDHDIVLRMEIVDRDSLFPKLYRGEGDIAAARLIPTAENQERFRFTRPLYSTRPTLVQQELPAPASDSLPQAAERVLDDTTATPAVAEDLQRELPVELMEPTYLRARLIRSPDELSGEEVALPEDHPYEDFLYEIADSITGDIQVVEIEEAPSIEAVIRRVADGELELTAAPENLAELKEEYWTNLRVQPVLGPQHEVAWGVRPNSPQLLAALNTWIEEHEGSALFNQLYTRYFEDREGYRERVESQYLTGETGRLSPYDEVLRKYAENIDWDWRLLAAQTYQESKFKPRARSWAGAMGLLQLMPPTAREFGVDEPYDPEENVAGATRFLVWLRNYWDDRIPDETERMKFILASYNTGHGHVEDARRLTEKYEGDPNVWEDVSYWLLQKSKKQYYNDPVVRYGYARGLEPVTYVARILERFDHYQEFVTDEAVAELAQQEA